MASPADDEVALVERRGKVGGPLAVVSLLLADVAIDERVRDVRQAVLNGEREVDEGST